MHKELKSRKFGYVQVAVQAFTYLLQRLPPQDSPLFARELLAQNVVRLCRGIDLASVKDLTSYSEKLGQCGALSTKMGAPLTSLAGGIVPSQHNL